MAATDKRPGITNRVIRGFERAVILSLVAMMMLVVALSTVELGWIIARDIITAPVLLLQIEELFEIFGFFLLVLIGVELLDTIKAYLRDAVVHVEIVLEVALIALARKVIVLDVDAYGAGPTLGIAALVAALAGAFFLERRSRLRRRRGDRRRSPGGGAAVRVDPPKP